MNKLNKLKAYWASLDQDIAVNKRELVLGIAACALAGVVIGTFLSPRITLTIGNNNGNNSGNAADSVPQEEDNISPEEGPEEITEE